MLLHAADVDLLIDPDCRRCWSIWIVGFAAAVLLLLLLMLLIRNYVNLMLNRSDPDYSTAAAAAAVCKAKKEQDFRPS